VNPWFPTTQLSEDLFFRITETIYDYRKLRGYES